FAGDCGRPARGVPGIDLPRDLSFLRAQFHARSGPAGRFTRAVRGERAGLVGHSFGGFAVLGATLIDDALPVVVALAPVSPLTATDPGDRAPRLVVCRGRRYRRPLAARCKEGLMGVRQATGWLVLGVLIVGGGCARRYATVEVEPTITRTWVGGEPVPPSEGTTPPPPTAAGSGAPDAP